MNSKHSRYKVNLYLNICRNQVNFRHSVRRAYHFFSLKMSKCFRLDAMDKKLSISNLSVQTYVYDIFRGHNNAFIFYFLIRKSNLPFKKKIFKILLFFYFLLFGLKKIRLSLNFIFKFLTSEKINIENDKICFFLDLKPPLDKEHAVNFKQTLFESILKDSNSKRAFFNGQHLSQNKIISNWHSFYILLNVSKLLFLLESLLAIFLSIFYIFSKKKRYKFFMIYEIVQALAVKNSNFIKQQIHFISSCTQGCYKPIWLTCSEKKFQTETSFVWNSISACPFVFSKHDLISFNIPKMHWSTEYIISDNHKAYLLKLRNDNNIKIKYKKLEYSDIYPNNIKLPLKGYLLVFPLTPHKLNFNMGETSNNDIFGSSNLRKSCIQFINDIVEISTRFGLRVIIKEKRPSPGNDPSVLEHIRKTSENKNVISINEHTGIRELIKNSVGCISFPITSTAEIASSMGKPSAFYTLGHLIKKNNFEFMDNDVLINKKELNSWIKNLI